MVHEGGSIGGGPTSGQARSDLRQINQRRLEQALHMGATGISTLDHKTAKTDFRELIGQALASAGFAYDFNPTIPILEASIFREQVARAI